MSDFVETETASLFRISEDVIGLKFKTDKLVQIHHAQEIDQGFLKIIQDKNHFFIIDATDIVSNMNNEASRFFSREGETVKYTRAVAIILNSLHIRMTAAFFIKFQKPGLSDKNFCLQRKSFGMV